MKKEEKYGNENNNEDDEATGEEYWQLRKGEIKDALGDFLDRWSWDWWCTFTFDDNYRSHSAKKAVIRFLHRVVPEFSAFLVVEPHRRDFVFHVHALVICNVCDVRRRDVQDKWSIKFGWARIEEYDPSENARFYVGKYILNPLVDYDFVNMKIVEPQQSF